MAKAAKLKPVSNPYLKKARNTGKDYLPSPTVSTPQPTIKKVKFSSARGV